VIGRTDSAIDTDAKSAGVLNVEPCGEPCSLPCLDDRPEHPSPWVRPRREVWVRLGVFGFACLVFLPNLGGFGLWDPWETHYGAVTTEMLDSYDWVSPWWGYREKIGDEPIQGSGFWSKPIFIFWSEASFARLIGRGDWAIRLPMATLAILAVYMTYLALSKVWSRRVGLIGALVTATSPEFFMISRQAQTDMPFVGTLVLALGCLMLALFAPRERLSRRRTVAWLLGTLVFVLLNTVPQYVIVANDWQAAAPPELEGTLARWVWGLGHSGAPQVALYVVILALVLARYAWVFRRELREEGFGERFNDRWVRRCLMVCFYVVCGQCTYAKGLAGFLLPGAIILVWLLLTWQWRVLWRVELWRGMLLFICTAFPWYVAMLTKHHPGFYERFFIHDHFNRLGTGVHQVDSGTFEHYIKWLGIGMFPWAAFVPFMLIGLVRINPRRLDPKVQAKVFVAVWFAIAFMLFTLMATKFHHYIFPAMPALAILLALFIDELMEDRGWWPRLALVGAVVIFGALAWDLERDPQHLRNLMTYKQDRPLPAHLPIDWSAPVAAGAKYTWADSTFARHTHPALQAILTTEVFRYDRFMPFLMIAGFVALALWFVAKTRMAGLVALGALATSLACWSLSYYMPSLSPHWSQRYLFDAYYDRCTQRAPTEEDRAAHTPILARVGLEGLARFLRYDGKTVCDEDVVSWLITWRGETYYSFNQIQPIGKEEQFEPYLQERNGGKTFYVLTERNKVDGFAKKLDTLSGKLKRKGHPGWTDIERWEVEVVCDENHYFQMSVARPIRGGGSS
jgi:4-amino-4-deoxy-L-arabinose transferase-like glycosyltransferase